MKMAVPILLSSYVFFNAKMQKRKIIVVSGEEDKDVEEQALQAGANYSCNIFFPMWNPFKKKKLIICP